VRGPRLVPIVAALGVALGVAAEAVSFAGLGPAVADLATGWTLLGCGLWGWRQRPGELRWPLLALAGLTWFAANFADAGIAGVASLAGALVFLHRGPLVHAACSGRGVRSPLALVTIAFGYADALGLGGGGTTVVVAVLLAAVGGAGAIARVRGATGPAGLELGAVAALAGGLGLAGAVALSGVTADASPLTTYAYDAALCGTALMLAAAAAREARTRATVADLVVELGPGRGSSVARDALAHALGDPDLEIGYWLADSGLFADRYGRELSLPGAGAGREVTIVEHGGEQIAALVHARAALDDPALAAAVRDAAGLVLANAGLQVAAERQLEELRASRRRLVAARDEQRRRLERRLHDGAQRHLRDVAAAVRDVRATTAAGGAEDELLDLIDSELAQAQSELRELARGIHPRALSEQGLAAALAALAERAPFPVELRPPAEPLPAPVEAAAYFVCSEALANVAKYARASRARCEVTHRDGRVAVAVSDDGIGGADPGLGSGLRGLADRVIALGGELHIASPPGAGTTVTADLPLPASVQCEP